MPGRTAWLVVAALLVASCRPSEEPGDAAAESIEGVQVVVPEGWSPQPTDTAPTPSDAGPAVVAWQRFGLDSDVDNLQVIVGCDGTASDLAIMAAQAPRPPLVVTDASEIDAPEVPGLDAVHRLRLVLGGGRPDDASTVRVSGLYGHAGDTLVLVEVTRRASADNEVADAVLDSVQVDRPTLEAACPES